MRTPLYGVDSLFVSRWSPRAMSGEPVPLSELLRLFEAARWAPSSGNNQPWRFVYARRDTADWESLFSLLGEGNRSWCTRAAALVVVISSDTRKTREGNSVPARTHSFDTGAAWACLALQGTLSGLVVHGMEGFDYERARVELGVPPGHTVECMVAVGRPGRVDELPERLRGIEHPNDRRSLSELLSEGRFGKTPEISDQISHPRSAD
jgi:nitroreductase